MTDQNEQLGTAQEGAGSAQGERAERRVEATDAARRRAEELGMNLAAVNGTGANNRITVDDVEDAYEQAQRTAKLAEVIQGASTRLTEDLQRLRTTSTDGTVLNPKEQGIVDQYNVLKAILADPETRVPPSPPDFPYDEPEKDFVPHPPLAYWILPDPHGYYLTAQAGEGLSAGEPERRERVPKPEQSASAERKKEE